MVNQKTDKGKRAAFSARMSAEAIVLTLLASATVGILTAQILAGGWEDSGSPVPTKPAGLRHDAISMASPTDTSQVFPTSSQNDYTATDDAAADQDKSSQSNDTVVRNGITIVSPPLLIPVISADAIKTPNGSEARKAPSARKRSHYANRAHRRGQRRVTGWAPFRRIVAGNP